MYFEDSYLKIIYVGYVVNLRRKRKNCTKYIFYSNYPQYYLKKILETFSFIHFYIYYREIIQIKIKAIMALKLCHVKILKFQ